MSNGYFAVKGNSHLDGTPVEAFGSSDAAKRGGAAQMARNAQTVDDMVAHANDIIALGADRRSSERLTGAERDAAHASKMMGNGAVLATLASQDLDAMGLGSPAQYQTVAAIQTPSAPDRLAS